MSDGPSDKNQSLQEYRMVTGLHILSTQREGVEEETDFDVFFIWGGGRFTHKGWFNLNLNVLL